MYVCGEFENFVGSDSSKFEVQISRIPGFFQLSLLT